MRPATRTARAFRSDRDHLCRNACQARDRNSSWHPVGVQLALCVRTGLSLAVPPDVLLPGCCVLMPGRSATCGSRRRRRGSPLAEVATACGWLRADGRSPASMSPSPPQPARRVGRQHPIGYRNPLLVSGSAHCSTTATSTFAVWSGCRSMDLILNRAAAGAAPYEHRRADVLPPQRRALWSRLSPIEVVRRRRWFSSLRSDV